MVARTIVRPVEPQRNKNSRDTRGNLVIVGFGLVLLFAVLGVVSSGIFLADRVSGAGTSPKHHDTSKSGKNGSSVAAAEIARAQAQATAIVKAAHTSKRSIMTNAQRKARLQASQILAAANKSAHSITSTAQKQAAATRATAQQYAASVQVAPTVPAYTYPVTTAPTATAAASGVTSGTTTNPSLQGLPASWKVVAYNATFGSGPGSAGAVTVVNRSSSSFSGTVVVKYKSGGSATAVFSGLAAGQSAVLPLNGPAYNGSGTSISLTNLH